MKEEEIRATVRRALKRVAPEADLEALGGEEDLRDTLDLDSMDFNGFVLALHETLHVDIPEKDYPRFFTLNGCVRELGARLGAAG
jgi:acyl carrier protein